jgi:hypothetical protein
MKLIIGATKDNWFLTEDSESFIDRNVWFWKGSRDKRNQSRRLHCVARLLKQSFVHVCTTLLDLKPNEIIVHRMVRFVTTLVHGLLFQFERCSNRSIITGDCHSLQVESLQSTNMVRRSFCQCWGKLPFYVGRALPDVHNFLQVLPYSMKLQCTY